MATPDAPRVLTLPGPCGRLSARDWGGEGPPVLLLHGMSGNSHWWDGVAPLLRGLRPIALDFRGHGLSAWGRDESDYRLDAFAADIDAAARGLGLSAYAIAAHSFGARVALEHASGAPAGLRKLAVLDFLCELAAGDLDRFARARERPQPAYASKEAILDRFRLHPRGTLLGPAALRSLGESCVQPAAAGGWTWRFDWRAYAVRYVPVWPILPAVAVPALAVRGERSAVMSREQLQRLAAALPRARAEELPGAHHHLPLDAPEACAGLLRRFLL
ncbi:MAG: alpha/beta hydrolase [Elusimicrobia bacterium]|nr:alpha/beta hydrolase [Elusimicrobiota bacterium]